MSHNYRVEKTEEGYRVHFCEDTHFPFSIVAENEDRAVSRANVIACDLARQQIELLKQIHYSPTRVVLTAPTD